MCSSCQNQEMAKERGHVLPMPDPQWPLALQQDFLRGIRNGCVGHRLVSETERVRVWSIRLAPGERIGFHCHVLDYFWTALTPGKSRSHLHDGRVTETIYEAGDTKHSSYAAGEFMVHDLENIGDTELLFTTVEFLDSANRPFPLPAEARRAVN